MDEVQYGLCWGTLQKANLTELIETAGRHGFPTLSVRPASLQAALEEGQTEASLRRLLADAGVQVKVIDAISEGLPGLPPKEKLPPAVAAGRSGEAVCFRAAEILECPIINVGHYMGEKQPLPLMAEAVGGIARRAADRGLQLVVEFIPESGIPTVGDALELVQAVGERNFTILLDPWHLSRSGGTVEDVRRLPPGVIGAMQLCDRTPPPPGTPYVPLSGRDLPGEGQLPLCELVDVALANSPGLSIEIEVFSEELRSLSLDAAAARVAGALTAWRASCAG